MCSLYKFILTLVNFTWPMKHLELVRASPWNFQTAISAGKLSQDEQNGSDVLARSSRALASGTLTVCVLDAY